MTTFWGGLIEDEQREVQRQKQQQGQKQMRGFFASLRMASGFWSGFGSRTSNSKGKSKDNRKGKDNGNGISKSECGVLPHSTSLRVRMTRVRATAFRRMGFRS